MGGLAEWGLEACDAATPPVGLAHLPIIALKEESSGPGKQWTMKALDPGTTKLYLAETLRLWQSTIFFFQAHSALHGIFGVLR